MKQPDKNISESSAEASFAPPGEGTGLRVVLIHIASWLVVFSLPYLLRLIYDQNAPKNPASQGFLYLTFLTGLLWAATFYLNAYLLVPKFLNRKKYLWYFILLIVLFYLIINIHGVFFRNLIIGKPFNILISAAWNLPAYLLSLAASTIYQLVKERL